MKQAIINPDLTVTFEHDAPVPEPKDWEITIKAATASINPVDWKAASHKTADAVRNTPHPRAPGKDFAGTVHSVGSKVFQFKPGDRVMALNHQSGFAEYSVAPNFSTVKLPDHVTFEEATTYGLPYFTAALGMFKDMPAPPPWSPARPSDYNPLLIYGASSAVGAYAVKLAALANIHPIIAVAGAAKDIIADILNPTLGDSVIDYREHKSSETLITAIKDAAGRAKTVKFAFDIIATEHTINHILPQVLDPHKSYVAYAVPISFDIHLPVTTSARLTFAPGLFKPTDPDGEDGANGKTNEGNRAFIAITARYLEFALGEHFIQGHPWKILPKGLNHLEEGLSDLKEGRNKSLKYVMRIGETNW